MDNPEKLITLGTQDAWQTTGTRRCVNMNIT